MSFEKLGDMRGLMAWVLAEMWSQSANFSQINQIQRLARIFEYPRGNPYLVWHPTSEGPQESV
jgi:hypothetical protein